MGLKSTQCWFEVERTLWSLNSGESSCAFEEQVGGCCKSENSRSKEDGVSRKLGTCRPKKMVTRLKSLGPIENYNFPRSMGLKTIQCWFEVERTLWSLNSGEASGACEQHVGGCCKSENIRTKQDGASRKFGTCGPKKMVTRLKSLGPIENYNLPWSMGLKSIQCCFEVERTLWSLNSGEASCACEQHVGGLASRKTAELKKIVPPESLKHVNQRRWWLY